MVSRTGGPNRLDGLNRFAEGSNGSSACRCDQCRHVHCCLCKLVIGISINPSCQGSDYLASRLFTQQRPCHSGILVCYRYRRHVLAAAFPQPVHPLAERVALAPSVSDHCATTMGHQRSQIRVAPFADPQHPRLAARTVLFRHQAQPRRTVTSTTELTAISYP